MDAADDTVDDTQGQLASLTDALVRVVSFRAGEKPDYDRIHRTFIDRGLLIKNTGETPEVSTVEQFIAARQPLVASGWLTAFEETGIGYRMSSMAWHDKRLGLRIPDLAWPARSTRPRRYPEFGW